MTLGTPYMDRPAALSFGIVLLVGTGVGASLALVAGLVGPFLLSLVAAACLTGSVYAFNKGADQIVALGSIALVFGMVIFTATVGIVAQTTFATLGTTENLIGLITAVSPFVLIAALAFGVIFLGLSIVIDVNIYTLGPAISGAGYVGVYLFGLAGLLWGSNALAEHLISITQFSEVVSFINTSSLGSLWIVLLFEIGFSSILLYLLWKELPSRWVAQSTEKNWIDISRQSSDVDERKATGRDVSSEGKIDTHPLKQIIIWLLAFVSLSIAAVYPLLVVEGYIPTFVERGINVIIRTPLFHILLFSLSVCAIIGILIVDVHQRARYETPKNIIYNNGHIVGPIILAIIIVPIASNIVDSTARALPSSLRRILTQFTAEVGSAVFLLGLFGGVTLLSIGIWLISAGLMYFRLIPSKAAGLAIGSGCLLIATFAAALTGAPPVLVFGGVAATILIWDIGENAVFLDQQVDPEAKTHRGELIHICSSFVVATLAIGIAYLVSYAPRVLSYAVTPVQLLVALILSVTATIGFLVLLRR